ncbi:F0F1 ATP synthase subunit alpha, partial [Candidatus Uhrbacteria bacterium CG_4_10_14_0_2_um_filter_41_7]
EAFAQFASDLDEATKSQIERGRRAMQVMKQDQYAPLSVAEQTVIVYALNSGNLDDIDVDKINEFEAKFLEYMNTAGHTVMNAITETLQVSDETKAELEERIKEFKSTFEN